MKRSWILSMVLIILVVSTPQNIESPDNDVQNSYSTPDCPVKAGDEYTLHDPIEIDSDSDFTLQGWPGDGTRDDPYRIEGLEITADEYCISIRHTDVFFVISDCYLKSFEGGYRESLIELYNVENAEISNCKILGSEDYSTCRIDLQSCFNCNLTSSYYSAGSVEIYSSTDCYVTENLFSKEEYSRIDVSSSQRIVVDDNRMFGHGTIEVWDSTDCVVSSNSLKYSYSQIRVYMSNDIQIMENHLGANSTRAESGYSRGINVQQSRSIFIVENKVWGTPYGLSLRDVTELSIISNTFYLSGISISSSDSSLEHYTHEIVNNSIDGKDIVYLNGAQDIVLDTSNAGQVLVVDSTNITVPSMESEIVSRPVQFAFSKGCTLLDCYFPALQNGILVDSSEDCTIVMNNLRFYFSAIRMISCKRCVVTQNFIYPLGEWSYDGIEVANSDYCNVTKNVIGVIESGIRVSGSAHILVSQNRVNASYSGITIYRTTICQIQNNILSQTTIYGIRIVSSCALDIYGNNISSLNSGIELSSCIDCRVIDNTLFGGGISVFGENLTSFTFNISSNTVNGRPLVYMVGKSDLLLNASDYGQVGLVDCKDVTVDCCQSENITRVMLAFCQDCDVKNASFSENQNIVEVYYSRRIELTENIFQGYSQGIMLSHSNDCVVSRCTLNSTSADINIYYSKGTLISDTTILSDYGIRISYSDGVVLRKLHMIGCRWQSVDLYGSADCKIQQSRFDCTDHLSVYDSSRCAITNCTFLNSDGIMIGSSDSCEFIDNDFLDCRNAIDMWGSDDCIIARNKIISSEYGIGVDISSSEECLIKDNIMQCGHVSVMARMASSLVVKDNQFIGGGIGIEGVFSFSLTNNTLNGGDIGLFRGRSGLTINPASYEQVILVDCTDTTVQSGIFSNVYAGIQLVGCMSCVVEYIQATDCYKGVSVHSSDECVVDSVIATQCQYGVSITSTLDCVVSSCNFTNNKYAIQSLYGSTGTVLASNTITNSRYGLWISITNGWISKNQFKDCKQIAIFVDGCQNSTFISNTVHQCDTGIYLSWGYQNDFLNNSIINNRVGIVLGGGSNNTFTRNSLMGNGLLVRSYSTYEGLPASFDETTVNGKELFIAEGIHNTTVDAHGLGQVILCDSSNVTIESADSHNASVGVELCEVTNCTVKDSSLIGHSVAGVYVYSSYNCNVSDNSLVDNEVGVDLLYSYNCNVTRNWIEDCKRGIEGLGGSACSIENNCISKSEKGIEVVRVIEYNINENRIVSCDLGLNISGYAYYYPYYYDPYYYPYYYYYQSYGCIVDKNAIYNGGTGIAIEMTCESLLTHNAIYGNDNYGIISKNTSSHNTLYSNQIGWNSINAHDDGVNNSWSSSTSKGNYWHDLSTDIVYHIPGQANSTDYCPYTLDDQSDPTLQGEDILEFEFGSDAIFAEWYTSDDFLWSFSLTIDGEQQPEVPIVNPNIRYQVDHLSPSAHQIKLTVSDYVGHTVSRSMTVISEISEPPTLDAPADVTYIEGVVGNRIVWNATDKHPSHFVVMVDGQLNATDRWNGSAISINIDGLRPGSYNYTLVVFDIAHNNVSDSVTVFVIYGLPPIDPLTIGAVAIIGVEVVAAALIIREYVVRSRKRAPPPNPFSDMGI